MPSMHQGACQKKQVRHGKCYVLKLINQKEDLDKCITEATPFEPTGCQSACKIDPMVRARSGSENGVVERSVTAEGSEPGARRLWRRSHARFLKRQLSLPVSTMSQ